MAYDQNEEEQVEALKNWWRKNGAFVIAALVLASALSLGWQWWQGQQELKAQQAGALFNEMSLALENLDSNPQADQQKPRTLAEQISKDYADTFYAELAALALARMDVDSGQMDAARARLQQLAEHAKSESVRPLARLRLAQLLWGMGQNDEALKALDGFWPEAFRSDAEALRGDVLRTLGRVEEARKAYDAALAQATLLGLETGLLRLKRDDLGGASHATP